MPTQQGDPAATPPVTTSPGRSTPTQADTFFAMVLQDLGAPVTSQNLAFLEGWAQRAENTKALNNPLATTLDRPGATIFNSIGVRNYPSMQVGAEATASTLASYHAIVGLLRSGNGAYGAQGNRAVYRDLNTWAYGPNAGYGDSFTSYVANVLAGSQGSVGSAATPGLFGSGTLGGVPGALGKGAEHIPGVQQGVDAAQAAGDVISSVPKFLRFVTSWRFAEIAGGFILLVVGIALLARQFGVGVPGLSPMRGATDDAEQTRSNIAETFGAAHASRVDAAYKEGAKQGEINAARAAGRRSVTAPQATETHRSQDGPIGEAPRRVQRRAGFEPESAERDRREARRARRGEPGSSRLARGDTIPF